MKVKGTIGKVEFTAQSTRPDCRYWFYVRFDDSGLHENCKLLCGKDHKTKDEAEADLKRFLDDLGAVYEVVE